MGHSAYDAERPRDLPSHVNVPVLPLLLTVANHCADAPGTVYRAANVAMKWGTVAPPLWTGRPTLIVGAGPSLKGFDLTQLRDKGYVVAVNGAIYDFPQADAWVTIDFDFIKSNYDVLCQPGPRLYIAADNEQCTQPPLCRFVPRAVYLRRTRATGRLSIKPEVVECGGTSGFTAFNIAFLKQANPIYLFGFDYSETNGSHYCPERYPTQRRPLEHWRSWANAFNNVADQLKRAGVKVINASSTSAITAFPRMTPQQAVDQL